jgi:hypothetical protein
MQSFDGTWYESVDKSRASSAQEIANDSISAIFDMLIEYLNDFQRHDTSCDCQRCEGTMEHLFTAADTGQVREEY